MQIRQTKQNNAISDDKFATAKVPKPKFIQFLNIFGRSKKSVASELNYIELCDMYVTNICLRNDSTYGKQTVVEIKTAPQLLVFYARSVYRRQTCKTPQDSHRDQDLSPGPDYTHRG